MWVSVRKGLAANVEIVLGELGIGLEELEEELEVVLGGTSVGGVGVVTGGVGIRETDSCRGCGNKLVSKC